MINEKQIKLIQTACTAVGLRESGRYYLLLGQYQQPGGRPVTSCKQLNQYQIDDLLAICESLGWRYPGKPDNHYRAKVIKNHQLASFAQQAAIRHLAGDLGWNEYQLNGMIERMTNHQTSSVSKLTPRQAWVLIESMKTMFGRVAGHTYQNINQIKDEQEAAKDGQTAEAC